MVSPHAGLVLGQRYRLDAPLGRGGMGSVWRATHLALGTAVAVKVIDAALAEDATAIARFRREAQAAAQLESPHVVRITDFGIEQGAPYLAMELLEGETLRARLVRGRMTPAAVAELATDLARGLGKAHAAGIVHRDLKPDNVFLARGEHREVVKLLDFGVAKIASPLGALDPLTRTGAALGTPHYMSPEQIEGRRDVDHRSDLWSLAVVVFECLCGRSTFVAETIGELVLQICVKPMPVPSSIAQVPPGLDAWFARAADRQPDRRFDSASAMAAELARVLDPLAATVPGSSRTSTPATSQGIARAGDARAGFTVAADPPRRRLELRLWGMWDLALAQAYGKSLREVAGTLPGRFRTLADVREFPPQRADVQEILVAGRRALLERVDRSASLVASALAQMQARRLHVKSGFEDEERYRFFTSVEEANAFLDAD